MAILQGNIAEQLEPGLREIVGDVFREKESYYSQLLNVTDSQKAAEHFLEFNYFGLPAVKTEGQPIALDEVKEGAKKNVSHTTYALAAEVSWEALKDEQYGRLKNIGRELGRSMRERIEVAGHMVYNDGFATGNETTIDGVSVFNASHVNLKDGSTWSNLSTADLTVAAMQTMFQDFMNLTDGTGKKIAMTPECLVVPPESWVNVGEIFQTALLPYSADNTINVLKGKMKTLIDPYINDTDSWFVRAPLSDVDAHFMFRERPMQDSWDDKKSRTSAFAIISRFSYVAVEAHGLYGSAGA